MTDALDWPTRGNFGRKTLLGPFTGDVATMLDKRGFFGLEPEATFLYGCLRDADGEMYEVCRRIPALAGQEGWSQMFLLSTPGNDCLRMDLDVLAGNATSENCIIDERDGVARWASNHDAHGHPFEITWSEHNCTWREDGTWALTGELIGPGLQWYNIWRVWLKRYRSLWGEWHDGHQFSIQWRDAVQPRQFSKPDRRHCRLAGTPAESPGGGVAPPSDPAPRAPQRSSRTLARRLG